MAAFWALSPLAAEQLGTETPAPLPENRFFVDYYTRILAPSGFVWPYLGGHGDAAADLSAWKFPTSSPAVWSPPELARALGETVEAALDWDHDGLDGLYLQRLFVELQGVLHLHAPHPARIDPPTCDPAVLPEYGAFPEPSWWPAGIPDALFTEEATDDVLAVGGLLCREADRRATGAARRAVEDLRERLLALDAATADLAAPAVGILDEDPSVDAIGDDLDVPPLATALEWMEGLDRVLAELDLRRRLAPWLAPLAAADRRESAAPAWRQASLLDCSALAGGDSVRFREEPFLDAWADVAGGELRVEPPGLFLEDPDLDRLVREVGARVALAIVAAARSSARQDGVELFRAEPLPRRRPDREYAMRQMERLSIVGDPLHLKELLRRRVDTEVLAAELGSSFAAELVAFRDGLRARVLEFDSQRGLEGLLYAVARLGVAVALDDPLAPEVAAEIFPWAPPERLEALRVAWPALVLPRRTGRALAVLEHGIDEFRTVRDLPPGPIAEFKMGALRELWRCVEPLVGHEEAERVRTLLRHARRNLQDARQARFASDLAVACEATPEVPALASRARFLLGRLLPDPPEDRLDALVAALDLAAPCGDRDAALLRFAALHDVLTAVFALESYAAGGAFDAPFDRAAALRVGGKPLAELDAWLRDYGPRQTRIDRIIRRRPPPDEADRYPDWMLTPVAPEPRPDDERYQRAQAAWGTAYSDLVRGRGYPATIEETGWAPLNDYIEEEERHVRIDVGVHGENGADGFTVRAVFSTTLRYAGLLDGDGGPAAGAESITWSRRNGASDRYEIEILRATREAAGFEFPVPRHPGLPGPAALREAQRFADLHVRRE